MKQDARKVYADIFDMPHWSPKKYPRMSLYERAAIFSPFAALDGYEDMVGEEARFVEKQEVLTEVEMENLNLKIAMIADALENGQHPLLTFTYFISDKCIRRHRNHICTGFEPRFAGLVTALLPE